MRLVTGLAKISSFAEFQAQRLESGNPDVGLYTFFTLALSRVYHQIIFYADCLHIHVGFSWKSSGIKMFYKFKMLATIPSCLSLLLLTLQSYGLSLKSDRVRDSEPLYMDYSVVSDPSIQRGHVNNIDSLLFQSLKKIVLNLSKSHVHQ